MARIKFGDVVRETKGKIDRNNNPYEFYVAGDHMDSEDLTIHRHGCFATDDVGPAFIREFKRGQVLCGSRRTYLKKVAVADFDGVTANTTFVLETKDQGVLMQELLPFIMLSEGFTAWSVGKSKGSTNPYVLFSDLADYEFDLPSIDVQQRLSELLWQMFRLKERYIGLIQASDELVKSQFIAEFGKKPGVAHDFPVFLLKDSCTIITGNTPSRSNADYYGNYIEWIKSDNIIAGENVLSHADESLSEAGMSVGRVVYPGAILMTCIAGSLNTIGNVAIVDRPVAFNQQINAIVPRLYNSLFLYYMLVTMKPIIHEATNKTLKCILSKGNLEMIEAIVPPIEQQKRFASFASQLDKSKFVAQKATTLLHYML